MSSREAQAIANSKNLDLVKISPNAKPPVCKIMDYGKYKYEQSRKEKEARKNQKTVSPHCRRTRRHTSRYDTRAQNVLEQYFRELSRNRFLRRRRGLEAMDGGNRHRADHNRLQRLRQAQKLS